jgi:5S rRNA maturation endonuclease (ribonuclease M5)
MIDKRERMYQAFGAFVLGWVMDLNHLSEQGWVLLVEGERDARALRRLGYLGNMATSSAFGRKGIEALGGSTKVVLMTDLDREGGVLAARYLKALSKDGLEVSLSERKRLRRASRGVFLHIENLGRFAEPAGS